MSELTADLAPFFIQINGKAINLMYVLEAELVNGRYELKMTNKTLTITDPVDVRRLKEIFMMHQAGSSNPIVF